MIGGSKLQAACVNISAKFQRSLRWKYSHVTLLVFMIQDAIWTEVGPELEERDRQMKKAAARRSISKAWSDPSSLSAFSSVEFFNKTLVIFEMLSCNGEVGKKTSLVAVLSVKLCQAEGFHYLSSVKPWVTFINHFLVWCWPPIKQGTSFPRANYKTEGE